MVKHPEVGWLPCEGDELTHVLVAVYIFGTMSDLEGPPMSTRTSAQPLSPPLAGILLVAVLFGLACGPQAPRPALPDDLRSLVEGAESRCGGLEATDKEGCYEEVILSRLDQEGVYEAIRALEAIGSWDPEVERSGHMYVHAIGITAYQNNPNWSETFGQCTELYQSGCYHGVIQARFMEMGEVTAADVNDLCEMYKADPADRFVLFQCLHGMGHGLTMLYGHDLPVALGGCDLLSASWDRQSCYGGAFMENIMNATAPHHMVDDMMVEAGDAGNAGGTPMEAEPAGMAEHTESEWAGLDTEDPLYPCSVMEERYVRECYVMQTSAILWLNGWDISEAADTCLTAPEHMRQTCIQSLGRDIAGHVVGDHALGLQECSKAEADLRPWCYVGFVKNLIDVSARTDGAFAFCPRLDDRAARLRCYEAIGEELYVLRATGEERAAECKVVSDGAQQACLFGARQASERPAAD